MNKHQCPECKNMIEVKEKYKVGDVIECPYCGIELEIIKVSEDNSIETEIIEEEK